MISGLLAFLLFFQRGLKRPSLVKLRRPFPFGPAFSLNWIPSTEGLAFFGNQVIDPVCDELRQVRATRCNHVSAPGLDPRRRLRQGDHLANHLRRRLVFLHSCFCFPEHHRTTIPSRLRRHFWTYFSTLPGVGNDSGVFRNSANPALRSSRSWSLNALAHN